MEPLVAFLVVWGVIVGVYWLDRFLRRRDQLAARNENGNPAIIDALDAISRDGAGDYFVSSSRTTASLYMAPPSRGVLTVNVFGRLSYGVAIAKTHGFIGSIETRAVGNAVRPPRGLIRTPTRWARFDAAFAVFVDRSDAAADALTALVARELMAWRGLSPRVVVHAHSARVDRDAAEGTAHELRDFLKRAERLIARLVDGEARVAFERPSVIGSAMCEVCATVVDIATARACALCETPFHHDCWEYNGGCAVFGCAGGPSGQVTAIRGAEKKSRPAAGGPSRDGA